MKELPTYNQFNEFLVKRCEVLKPTTETLKTNTVVANEIQNKDSQNYNFKNLLSKYFSNYPNKNKLTKLNANFVSSYNNCLMCNNKVHQIFLCNAFKCLSVADRIKHIDNLKLCKNCFYTVAY